MSGPLWSPGHPLIGRVLEKRFQVASFICEGGMAQVFCGVQSAEPRHVAIKVMHPELADDAELVARFLREAKIAQRLQHPNIVRVLHAGEDRELTYMAMELLFGDDLSARVKTKGSFTESRAVEIMVDVCAALEHAHQQGVVHRDIKPENVMLCRQPNAPMEESVRVLDFGIAKILDARPDVALAEEAPTGVRSVLTRVGTWVGTPAYMSPEQGRAEPLDHRSDIYSAGVLLYELLCGRPPFEGQTPLQIIARHVQEVPPPPHRFGSIHPELERIVLRALAKRPEDRPPTARALGEALAAVLPDLDMASSQRWSQATLSGKASVEPTLPSARAQDRGSFTAVDEAPTAARALPRAGAYAASPGRDPTLPSSGQARPAQAGWSNESSSHDASSLRELKQTVTIELSEAEVRALAAGPQAKRAASASGATSHPLVGRLLAERYHVASFIREGSMAQIFCGLSDAEPKHVAIKVVHPELAGDREIVSRFLREGQVASRLAHPNIVRVLDVGEDGDLLFLVMELLFGDDLSARIKQRGSFTQERAIQIVVEVCRALAHAHAQGVVHRDIKPENIMLCRDPEAPEHELVKVLDFGIAKILDERSEVSLPTESPTQVRSVLTRVGALVGTPAYMSPEQGRAEKVDHRSDLYSVGVLLFELVCGRPPFEGETPLQIVMRHVREQPPKPSSLAQVAPELEAIMLRALAKDPAQRFQSADELIRALESVGRKAAQVTGSGAASDRWLRHTGRGQAAQAAAPAVPAAAAPAASVDPAPRPNLRAVASTQKLERPSDLPNPPSQARPPSLAPPAPPPPFAQAQLPALAPQPAAAAQRSDSPSNADARIARLLKLVTILLVALVLVLAAFVVVLVVVLERR